AAERRKARVDLAGSGDDDRRRVLRSTEPRAQLRECRRELRHHARRRPHALWLSTYGRRADDDDVGNGAEQREDETIGGMTTADLLRALDPRRVVGHDAIERADEVREHDALGQAQRPAVALLEFRGQRQRLAVAAIEKRREHYVPRVPLR